MNLTEGEKARLKEMEDVREAVKAEVLSEEEVDGFSVIKRFDRQGGKGEVVFLNTL